MIGVKLLANEYAVQLKALHDLTRPQNSAEELQHLRDELDRTEKDRLTATLNCDTLEGVLTDIHCMITKSELIQPLSPPSTTTRQLVEQLIHRCIYSVNENIDLQKKLDQAMQTINKSCNTCMDVETQETDFPCTHCREGSNWRLAQTK